jgi:hypothetical protein
MYVHHIAGFAGLTIVSALILAGLGLRTGLVLVRIFAWAWALLAGVGGLVLLIHEGPLPITNGWFAMFSGIAACPLTATISKKYAHVTIPGYVQFLVALLIFIAGRIAVAVLLHRPFLPHCEGKCW